MGISPDDMNSYTDIVDRYKNIRHHFEFFSRVLEDILRDASIALGISASIQVRAKGIPNFAEKIIRKKAVMKDPVNYFTDLCGARVIVDHQDDIMPFCDFIKNHFEIDIDNSLDALERLGASEFGYRSVHFIVSLKPGSFEKLLKSHAVSDKNLAEILYKRRTSEECDRLNLPPGAKYKAEIQVRTILQHAWAVFSHDRVYKSNFDVPHWLQRDVNRIAALLENADSDFSRAIRAAEQYETQYGVYLSKDAREQKKNEIRAILKFDPDNKKLVHRLAQLSASLGEWNECIDILKPVVDSWSKSSKDKMTKGKKIIKEDTGSEIVFVRDPDMSAILTEYGRSLWKRNKIGRNHIEKAILLDDRNTAARLVLAETFKDDEPEKAYPIYTQMYSIATDAPEALEGIIDCKIRIGRDLDFIMPMIRNIESAIETCRKRANVGVSIPQSYYTMGFFSLLLDKPFESLSAYTKAVTESESLVQVKDAFLTFKRLKASLLGRLTDHRKDYFEWIYRYLLAAVYTKALKIPQEKSDKFLKTWINELKEAIGQRVDPLSLDKDKPMVIVAGGCHQDIEEDLLHYRPLMEKAFEGFNGTVFCGGTRSGISGIVGDLCEQSKGSFKLIAFLPELIPPQASIHPAYKRYQTDGKGYSPLESIHVWLMILQAGIDPSDVRLLGINGGSISAIEYRMGVSLGANTGIIKDSGRSATIIFEDSDWKKKNNLYALPTDPQTVKCFIQGPPETKILDSSLVENMARETHEEYRENQNRSLTEEKPSMLEWEKLPDYLKKSNREYVMHIETKLNAVGLTIGRINQGEAVQLTDEQIETMAEIEHGRWNMEKIRDGWTLGPRDDNRKIHPHLLTWQALSEEVRDYDREPIRKIPERLGKYGFQVIQMMK